MKYIYKTAFKIPSFSTAKAWVNTKKGPIGKAMIGPGILMLGTAIGVVADNIFELVKKSIGKQKEPMYFKKMLEAHPALMKEPPENVAKLWSTLYYHAPNMAQDPVASGAFIRQSIGRGYIEEWGGPSPDTYKTLTDIQGALSNKKVKSDIGPKVRRAFSAQLLADTLSQQGEKWIKSDEMKKNIFDMQIGE